MTAPDPGPGQRDEPALRADMKRALCDSEWINGGWAWMSVTAREVADLVAAVLAAQPGPASALEHNVRVFLSEWDATPEDELDAPAPVIGMVEAMRQNVAAQPPPADTPEEPDNA